MNASDDAKRCSRCGLEKSAGRDFYWIKSRNGTKRPYSYCKPCGLATRRENNSRPEGSEDRRSKESRIARGIVRAEVSEKRCARCEQTIPVEGNFYRTRSRSGEPVWAGYCIPCTKAKVVEWQKDNPDRKAASDKKQNQKPERRARKNERGRKRHAADPSKSRDRMRRWNEANPGKSSARSTRWRKENIERSQAIQRKHHWHGEGRRERVLDHIRLRRAFLKDQEINGSDGRKLNRQVWLAILAAFDNRCCYCDSPDNITIEHLTALRRGGRNEISNIAPACRTCNLRKKAKTAEEFAPDRAPKIRRKALLACEPMPLSEAAD